MDWDTREVADRLQITELLATYTHAIDQRDFDRVATCFTADAVLDYSASGGPAAPRDDAVAWLRDSLAKVDFTQHFVTNQRIAVTGDEATSDAYFFHPLVAGGGEPILMGGTYHDELRRTPDGWRITYRVQDLTWIQGVDPGTLGVTIRGE